MTHVLLAQADFVAGFQDFLRVVQTHWGFCLLHFLEFAIWGAWYVVLGNFLSARGFSRVDIGRIYGTIPLGSIVSPLFIGILADKYVNQEVLLGVLHLAGGVLLLVMANARNPRPFYWICFVYALCYAPTLGLVNSIIFAHNDDLFAGRAGQEFPWIRVFGTIGWIAAGLSHRFLLTPGQPVNQRPIQLAAVLSLALGAFAFTLPATAPAPAPPAAAAQVGSEAVPEPGTWDAVATGAKRWATDALALIAAMPVFLAVTLVVSIAMAVYFAFGALFLEKSGVQAHNVGPVMTIGQMIEIFFLLALPAFLGPNNERMLLVLTIGTTAWAVRFALFAIGKPMILPLLGVAIHGICFDFFFAAGFIYIGTAAPRELAASAQSIFLVLAYGLGMWIGTEGSGWLNSYLSRTERRPDGTAEIHTNWRVFWSIACAMVTVSLIAFRLSGGQ